MFRARAVFRVSLRLTDSRPAVEGDAFYQAVAEASTAVASGGPAFVVSLWKPEFMLK